MIRSTHTFARLELSPEAYGEIRAKLDAAGYRHAFDTDDGGEIINMHGIGIAMDRTPPVGQLDRALPLVLYFADANGRDAFMTAVREARPDLTEMVVP